MSANFAGLNCPRVTLKRFSHVPPRRCQDAETKICYGKGLGSNCFKVNENDPKHERGLRSVCSTGYRRRSKKIIQSGIGAERSILAALAYFLTRRGEVSLDVVAPKFMMHLDELEKARQDSEFLVLGSDTELRSPKKWMN